MNTLQGPKLKTAFARAASEHYDWQTSGPGVAERERALVHAAFLPLRPRLLDLGCGEGATLFHLGEPAGAWGVDLFPEKLHFARDKLRKCHFACASVCDLPFAAQSFDQLVVRDLIHHLDDPGRFIAECERILGPGGRIDILEPCRNNPLIFLHALALPVERGELRSTMSFLTGVVSQRFEVTATARLQGLPVHRIVFHPELGRPAWGRSPLARRMVDAVESLADAVIPRFARAYLHIRAVKR